MLVDPQLRPGRRRRVDPAALGIGREVFLEALVAEGIPAVAGYPIPLYRQPLFLNAALGPYSGARSPRSNPANPPARCPCREILSTEQGMWLPHRVLLGDERDMDDVAAAVQKVVDHRHELM